MADPPLEAAIRWLQAQPDVRYAEARLVDESGERLRVRDGRPEQVTAEASRGVGIRVLGSKTWGFACSADVSEAHAARRFRRRLLRTPIAHPQALAAHLDEARLHVAHVAPPAQGAQCSFEGRLGQSGDGP